MTVVVGVDNSPASRAALELAAQEARWRQAPLVAVSAFEPRLGTAVAGYPAAAMHTEGEQKATAESELRALSMKRSVARESRPTCVFLPGWPAG